VSGEVAVSFGELANAQSNISSTSQRVNAQLDDLRNFVARLVGAWEGAAREAYHVQQTKLDQAANELNQVLSQIGVAVGTANDSYQAAERSNTTRFSG
jgi:early secretory antigenic target protein ESAT-6